MDGGIEVSRVGATCVVSLRGVHDRGTGERFRLRISQLLRERPDLLIVDLSAVTSIDSTMVHALLRASLTARTNGVRVAHVVGENATVRRFVEGWRLDDELGAPETLPDVLLAAAQTSSSRQSEASAA